MNLYVPKVANYTYDNEQSAQTAIIASSKYQKESLDFLKLLYADQELGQLLAYGIEGRQYEINEDRLVYYNNDQYNNEHNISNEVFYRLFTVFPVDSTRAFPIKRLREKYINERKKMNANIQFGALRGHTVDFSEVEEEYQKCTALFEEYSMAFIGYYEHDTEAKLKELNEKLKAAGYEKLIQTVNEYIEKQVK